MIMTDGVNLSVSISAFDDVSRHRTPSPTVYDASIIFPVGSGRGKEAPYLSSLEAVANFTGTFIRDNIEDKSIPYLRIKYHSSVKVPLGISNRGGCWIKRPLNESELKEIVGLVDSQFRTENGYGVK